MARGGNQLVTAGTFKAFDLTVAVEAVEPLASQVRDGWADIATAASPTQTLSVQPKDTVWQLSWDGAEPYDLSPLRRIEDELISIFTRGGAAAAAASHSVVHSVAFEISGRGYVCIGESGSGKSTLGAQALLAGQGFLSEECTAITEDGIVRSFARPIGLRRGGADALGIQLGTDADSALVKVSELGRIAAEIPIECLVLLNRRAGTPKAESLSPARGLFELAGHAVGAGGVNTTSFRRLERLAKHVPVVVLHYSSAADAIEVIARLQR